MNGEDDYEVEFEVIATQLLEWRFERGLFSVMLDTEEGAVGVIFPDIGEDRASRIMAILEELEEDMKTGGS